MRSTSYVQHYISSCNMRSLTFTSLTTTITQQQHATLTISQGSQIIDNIKSNNDSEIVNQHTNKHNKKQIDDKQRGIEKETPKSREGDIERENYNNPCHKCSSLTSWERQADQPMWLHKNHQFQGTKLLLKNIYISKPLRFPNCAACVANI